MLLILPASHVLYSAIVHVVILDVNSVHENHVDGQHCAVRMFTVLFFLLAD